MTGGFKHILTIARINITKKIPCRMATIYSTKFTYSLCKGYLYKISESELNLELLVRLLLKGAWSFSSSNRISWGGNQYQDEVLWDMPGGRGHIFSVWIVVALDNNEHWEHSDEVLSNDQQTHMKMNKYHQGSVSCTMTTASYKCLTSTYLSSVHSQWFCTNLADILNTYK